MGITIKEVAVKANVGVGTISRVMNNSPHISHKTREKVLKVIKEVNYRPNMLGWRLRKQKTFTIGVLMPALGDGMFSFSYLYNETLQGIITIFNKDSNYDILLLPPHDSRDKYTYIRLFDQQKVDGIIILNPRVGNPGLIELEEKRVFAVLINVKSSKLDYVDTDNLGSTYKILEHLIKLGRKRIGIITVTEKKGHYKERFDAYKSALLKNGLPYIEELVAYIPEGAAETAGYEEMKKLLVHKPTAVFAADDRVARKAIDAIQAAGLRVPEDIAVVGFDDNPLVVNLAPRITTMRQSYFELGKEAAKMLLDRIEGRAKKQQRKIVSCKLIVRESSNPNKGG
jgi:DNA-binding LacI/PurR family transcriptional regulator